MKFRDNISNLDYIEKRIIELNEIGYDVDTISEILNVLPEYATYVIHKFSRW